MIKRAICGANNKCCASSETAVARIGSQLFEEYRSCGVRMTTHLSGFGNLVVKLFP